MKWQSMLELKPLSLATKYGGRNQNSISFPEIDKCSTQFRQTQPTIEATDINKHSIKSIRNNRSRQYIETKQTICGNKNGIKKQCSIELLKQNILNDTLKSQSKYQVNNSPGHNDQSFDTIGRSDRCKQNVNEHYFINRSIEWNKTQKQKNSLYYSRYTSTADPVMDIQQRQSISSLKNSLETYRFRVGYLDHQIKQKQSNEEVLTNALKTKFEKEHSILNDKITRLNNQVKEKDRIICQLLNRQT